MPCRFILSLQITKRPPSITKLIIIAAVVVVDVDMEAAETLQSIKVKYLWRSASQFVYSAMQT